uniref:INO80 complex subunit C isoform X3 n=1 Tax=Myodes glareolus TaxID=447135 RepID=UPI0020208DDB|nr:INO80 complex subunit C isoform X3 [Myodes glareolus]
MRAAVGRSHCSSEGVSIEAMSENKMASSEFSSGPVEKAAKPLPFKDPNFVHSGHGGAVAGKKNRTWKNLKQILAAERALPWQLNDPNYFSIDAPPSFKPAKKYSDVSGLLFAVLEVPIRSVPGSGGAVPLPTDCPWSVLQVWKDVLQVCQSQLHRPSEQAAVQHH